MTLDFNGAVNVENNSGQGPNAQVPDVVAKKFNWGAFFFSWIWGIVHKAWLTLIILPACLIPFVGGFVCLGLQIWYGIKGNEWAWQNKRFESVEAFHANQIIWARVGVILCVIGIVFAVIGFVGVFLSMGSSANY